MQDIAVIDITGVSLVDTQVANALIRAAQAVKLLGAQAMLTGFVPRWPRRWWAYRLHDILYHGVVVLSRVFIDTHERMILARRQTRPTTQ